MRYRMLGCLMCACAVAVSIAAPLLETGGRDRYHQHWDAPPKTEDAPDAAFSTHLPLVEIDTGGETIPGRASMDEEGALLGYTTTADGADRIKAHMDIVDHESTCNHPGDAPAISTDIEIHVRGRSSRTFDKSNYAIRLENPDGTNNPQAVMGMDAHHEWVLHGPYLDKTLMRNYMLYNIGGEIMDYAPNVRFCEVMLNGEYQGVYVMMERITAGKDGARLDLTVDAKRNTFSGYLLRMDLDVLGKEETIADIDHFTSYAKRTQQELEIIYPGAGNLTETISREICQDFSDFEKALYSYDYDSEKYGYWTYIDTESFIDYFLINEITCNYDAGWLSTYMYKDTTGKYRMCLWDMNSACDNYQESQFSEKGFRMQNCLWYFMLMKDEDFVDALIRRYWALRDTYFSEEYLNRYIDDTVAYLGDAVDRNFQVWGYTFRPDHVLLHPAERNLHSYEEAIGQMKAFYAARLSWMDENIDTLRQYAAESKVKKFNENAN